MVRLPAAAAAILLLAGAAQGADELHLSDHPLVDTIVRTRDGAVIDRAALEAALLDARFVIIGEKHDNPRHHAIQAMLVERIGAAGELDAVALEMLRRDQQLDVTLHFQEGGDAAGLAEAVDWEDLGWGPWTWYGPIVHAAARHGATIVAANISRGDARAIYESGFEGFADGFVARTGLDVALDGDEQAAREAAMVEAHCGYELGDGAAAMVDVQRARDAMMADRLATLTDDGQGVLITGNAHADIRRGVPPVLAQLSPGADALSLGLIEVAPELAEPPADLPYDYVWLTPRAKPVDFDYCAQFDADRG